MEDFQAIVTATVKIKKPLMVFNNHYHASNMIQYSHLDTILLCLKSGELALKSPKNDVSISKFVSIAMRLKLSLICSSFFDLLDFCDYDWLQSNEKCS